MGESAGWWVRRLPTHRPKEREPAERGRRARFRIPATTTTATTATTAPPPHLSPTGGIQGARKSLRSTGVCNFNRLRAGFGKPLALSPFHGSHRPGKRRRQGVGLAAGQWPVLRVRPLKHAFWQPAVVAPLAVGQRPVLGVRPVKDALWHSAALASHAPTLPMLPLSLASLLLQPEGALPCSRLPAIAARLASFSLLAPSQTPAGQSVVHRSAAGRAWGWQLGSGSFSGSDA